MHDLNIDSFSMCKTRIWKNQFNPLGSRIGWKLPSIFWTRTPDETIRKYKCRDPQGSSSSGQSCHHHLAKACTTGPRHIADNLPRNCGRCEKLKQLILMSFKKLLQGKRRITEVTGVINAGKWATMWNAADQERKISGGLRKDWKRAQTLQELSMWMPSCRLRNNCLNWQVCYRICNQETWDF